MWFGTVPIGQAEGALLAHAVRDGRLVLAKGRPLSAADCAALAAAGIADVDVCRPDAGDIGEDVAAARVAAALAGSGVKIAPAATGRVNLFACADGLAMIDAVAVAAVNRQHEAVTVATLAPFAVVTAGQMVATVKIVPLVVPEAAVVAAIAAAGTAGQALAVAPFTGNLATGLIQTELPGTKPSVLDKTTTVTATRLTALGGRLVAEARCPHRAEALAATLERMAGDLKGELNLLLLAGASAVTDRRDVLPMAIERAGGEVLHVGMPVDPGNLLILGRLGDLPVIGLPGCARSPRLNGFDWVLQRLAAGLSVNAGDIAAMGVGGLLAEIPERISPRQGSVSPPQNRQPRVAALVLAAGRSTRMGAENKLLADVGGVPLIAHTVDRVLQSAVQSVFIVTGHQSAEVRAALAGRSVSFVHNRDFCDGLSTSLKAGLAAMPADVDAVLVCLGDMPEVTSALIDRLIAAWDRTEGRTICVPVFGGKRGNPVLWDRGYFGAMCDVAGDAGAKHLIGRHREAVCEVTADAAVLRDIDTPGDLAALNRRAVDAEAGSAPATAAK